MLSFPQLRERFKENLDIRAVGLFPDIILCMRTPETDRD